MNKPPGKAALSAKPAQAKPGSTPSGSIVLGPAQHEPWYEIGPSIPRTLIAAMVLQGQVACASRTINPVEAVKLADELLVELERTKAVEE